MRALVVDDASSIRLVAAKILTNLGMEVHQAEDGVKALEAIASHGHMDLILLDWRMPEMDGPTFLKRLREDPSHAKTVVLMVTIEATRDAIELAAQSGCSGFIRKPFDRAALESRVRALMGVGSPNP